MKFNDAELIGVPTIVVVGRGLADGIVEVKDRASGERTEVPVAEVAEHLVATRPRLTLGACQRLDRWACWSAGASSSAWVSRCC